MKSLINVYTKRKVDIEERASNKQVRYLMLLCKEAENDFPFTCSKEATMHLDKMTVYRSIKQLQKGYKLVFIIPDSLNG
ncbi:MAG: hypothetical protein AB7S48_07210 [Bacteroidales bacterium]